MRIKIEGRQPIRGVYRVAGNSNSALLLVAASMLGDSPVSLSNVPETQSVGILLEIGEALGLKHQNDNGVLRLQTPAIFGRQLTRDYAEALTSSMLFIAPLLARRRHLHMELAYPVSRLQTHFSALQDLGCEVKIDGPHIDLAASPWDTREIMLMQTSVTATALAAMLATALGRKTTILNAASEPQIADLLALLAQMGARIEGVGSNLLTIHGVGGDALPTSPNLAHSLSPDPIEAASVAAMAALTGGRLTIEGTRRRDLRMVRKVYERLGLTMSLDEDAIIIPVHESLSIAGREEDVDLVVESAPHPGFPSDLIAMATVIATQARGTTLIHEKLFNTRLLFVDRLTAMGAQIILCDPHRAIVVGHSSLRGDYIDTPDVRTGLAMLAAALCAEGQTIIDNAETFDRTFDNVLDKLVALGAAIWRG
jgi:UDP-N-acetylglucosamine 1-carboxyvinyltransferase